MKKLLISYLFLLSSTLVFAQENQGVFSKENTWGKEILKFPLGFAREIPYEGYADVRFHKDWSKENKAGFWSYLFAWHVKGNQNPTLKELETYMKYYYDGLVDGKRPDRPESIILFLKSNSKDIDYVGKMSLFDRFTTNKVIILHMIVKTFYCKENDTSNIVFQISPKPFEHKIWEELKSVKLRDDICLE